MIKVGRYLKKYINFVQNSKYFSISEQTFRLTSKEYFEQLKKLNFSKLIHFLHGITQQKTPSCVSTNILLNNSTTILNINQKIPCQKKAYLWNSWRPNKGRKDLNIHTSLGGFCVWGRRLAVVLLVDELEQKVGLVRLKVSWDMTHRPIAFEDTILVIATVFARENSKVLQFFHTKELKWYSLKTSRMKKRWKTLIFGSGLERDIRKL